MAARALNLGFFFADSHTAMGALCIRNDVEGAATLMMACTCSKERLMLAGAGPHLQVEQHWGLTQCRSCSAQVAERVHHRQGRQAADLAAQGQGCAAGHPAGAGQEGRRKGLVPLPVARIICSPFLCECRVVMNRAGRPVRYEVLCKCVVSSCMAVCLTAGSWVMIRLEHGAPSVLGL